MYMGHFGIALGARPWLARAPMAWLLFCAVEPDLLDAASALIPGIGVHVPTHTLPGIFGEAVALGVITWLWLRQWKLALGCVALVVSHLAADLMTSWLLMWPGGPDAGLRLYTRPWADFALETAVIIAGLCLYIRSPDLRGRVRAGAIRMSVILIVLQAVWDFGFGHG